MYTADCGFLPRRVGRVVYGAGLENQWAKALAGSNPAPSANLTPHSLAYVIDLKEEGEVLKPQDGRDPLGRTISWSGQLRYHPNKSAIVIAAVIFFGVAVLVQIFQRNIITTVFFALVGAVILLNIRRKPEIGRFEINPAGIVINNIRRLYSETKSFWIEYDQELGIQELSLQLKKWYAPYVKIPIYGQNPVQLRLALLEFLPEIEHKDSIVEILSRKLGL